MIQTTNFGRGLTSAEIEQLFATSVVKRVVEAIGGKLEAHAQRYQMTFVVTIPCTMT